MIFGAVFQIHSKNPSKIKICIDHTETWTHDLNYKSSEIYTQQSTSGVWDCRCPYGYLPWRHLHYQSRHRRWYTCLLSPRHQSVIIHVILIFVIPNICHLYINCNAQNATQLVARGRHIFKYFQISNQQSTSGVWDCGCPNGDLPWRHLHYQSRHRRWYTCLSSPWHQSVIMIISNMCHVYMNSHTQSARKLVARGRHIFRYF